MSQEAGHSGVEIGAGALSSYFPHKISEVSATSLPSAEFESLLRKGNNIIFRVLDVSLLEHL